MDIPTNQFRCSSRTIVLMKIIIQSVNSITSSQYHQKKLLLLSKLWRDSSRETRSLLQSDQKNTNSLTPSRTSSKLRRDQSQIFGEIVIFLVFFSVLPLITANIPIFFAPAAHFAFRNCDFGSNFWILMIWSSRALETKGGQWVGILLIAMSNWYRYAQHALDSKMCHLVNSAVCFCTGCHHVAECIGTQVESSK